MNTRTTLHTSSVAHQAETYSLLLQHGAYIERLCAGLFGGIRRSEDRDEARAELFLSLVEGYPRLRLDNARNRTSVVQSWIYFQGLAVQKKMSRFFKKVVRERSGGTVEVNAADAVPGSRAPDFGQMGFNVEKAHATGSVEMSVDAFARLDSQHDARIVVEAIFAEATPKQREACMSYMLEMDAAEMEAKYGMTISQRADRMKTIRTNLPSFAA